MEQLKLMNSDHSIYIQPSQWVIDWYLSKNVINKMAPMPFGVDTERFNQVKPIEQRNKVLLYKKCRKPEDIESVIQILNKNNIQYELFDYEKRYEQNYYLDYLHDCKFGIWVDGHESQGFALEEALSCNVPLLVWNAKSLNVVIYDGRPGFDEDFPATTIPYWDERCGEYFNDSNELEEKFNLFLSKLHQYRPRDFVIENLSFEKCEEKLFEVINKI